MAKVTFALVCGSGTCCLGISPETTAHVSPESGSAVESPRAGFRSRKNSTVNHLVAGFLNVEMFSAVNSCSKKIAMNTS